MAVHWSLDIKDIQAARRLDPEFFDPRAVSVADRISNLNSSPLSDWVRGAWRGLSPNYDPAGNVRVVKTAHVQRFELLATPQEFITIEEDDDAYRARIPQNALLITSTGVGSLGRCFFYTGDDALVADGHVTVLPFAGTREDGAYVCAFLQSPAGRQQIVRLHRGSSRQIEIYPADLLELPIPFLPEKQRREIGMRWLQATDGVQAASAAVKSAEAMIEMQVGLDALELPSVRPIVWEESFKNLSSGRRLDPEHATPFVQELRNQIIASGARSLRSLATNVWKGVQPSTYDPDGNVRVVKTKNVSYPEFDLNQCEHTFDEGWTRFLQPGDLLLNITGEGTLGRAGVVPAEGISEARTVAAIDISTIAIDPTQALPEYVALFLNSWMGRRQTYAMQTGSSGQQHLYPAHFAAIYIPIPVSSDGQRVDLDWQKEVVAVAKRRSIVAAAALRVGAELDRIFDSAIGVPIDLGTIPV